MNEIDNIVDFNQAQVLKKLKPVLEDVRNEQIEELIFLLNASRKKMKDLRTSENLTKSEFYKLSKPKLKLYSKLKKSNFLFESAIITLVKDSI